MTIRGLRSHVDRLRRQAGAGGCPECGHREGGPVGGLTFFCACGPFPPPEPPDRPKCGTCGHNLTTVWLDGDKDGVPWHPLPGYVGWYSQDGRVVDNDGNPMAGAADESGLPIPEDTAS